MDKPKADETVTIRLPKGTARKLTAASGQPFSRLMRAMAINLLDQLTREANAKEAQQ